MKTQNECLFSIKLKNGMVITGTCPEDVQHLVLDLQLACHDSILWTMQESDESEMKAWTELMSDYEKMFHDTWFTIYKYTKSQED